MPTLEGFAFDDLLSHNSTTESVQAGTTLTPTTASNRHLILFSTQGLDAVEANVFARIVPVHVTGLARANGGSAGQGLGEGLQQGQSSGPTEHMGQGAAWVEAVDASGVGIAMDRGSGSSAVNARNNGIVLIDVEDIADDTTQLVHANSADSAITSSASYVSLEQISVTPNAVGEKWLLLGSVAGDMGAGDVLQVRLYNETNSDEIIARGSQGSENYAAGANQNTLLVMAIYTAVGTDAITFDLRARTNGTSTQYDASSLVAVRLASLSSNFATFGEDGGIADHEVTTAMTDERMTNARASLTPSGSDPILLLGSGYIDAEIADSGASMWWTDDGNTTSLPATVFKGDLNTNYHAVNDAPPISVFGYEASPAASATDYDIYYWSGRADTSFHEFKGVALEMDGGDGGPPPSSNAGAITALLGYYYDD